MKKSRDRTKRVLLVIAGVVSVSLATVGIIVPLLPTTPFLLLAAACFVRSSDSLYEWLINNRLFGSYVHNYREHRAVTWQTKLFTLLLLWIAVAYSGVVVLDSWVFRTLLFATAIAVTVHVLNLGTLSNNDYKTSSEPLEEPAE